MMIDIHSHVLPGLDDGAASTEEALGLLAQYSGQAVVGVVCTPHFYAEMFASPDALSAALDARDERLVRLQDAANGLSLGVTLLSGAELMLTTAMLPYIQQSKWASRLAINGGFYLLVELPVRLSGDLRTLEGLLFEIQLAGMLPILAHPERSAHNEGFLPVLKDWADSGRVLMQANAGHLVDDPRLDAERRSRYSRRRSILLQMIGQGMIHFIASDAHDPTTRPCQHQAAFDTVSGQFGRAVADRLMRENPSRAIHSMSILK